MSSQPLCACLFVLALLTPGQPQSTVDFTGTWLHVPSEGAQAGGEPRRMIITQAAAEMVVVRKTARGDETSMYRLDGTETVESNMLGDTRVRATWDGQTLVVTRTRTLDGPDGPVPAISTEAFALDAGRLIVMTRRPMPQGGYRTEEITFLRDPQ